MNARERNLGIDLMRILCMLSVVITHMMGYGWIIQLLNPQSWKYELAIALQSMCVFGVSGFALISGYVGVNARYRYSALAVQWAKVWFYSVGFTALASALVPGSVTGQDWQTALFPTLKNMYWYFSAYAACHMLAPVLRMAMRSMNARQAGVCAASLAVMFSMLTNLFGSDAFYANAGKSTLWLAVLYVIGAYFGRFQPHARLPKAVLWAMFIVSALLMAGTRPVARRLGAEYLSRELWDNSFRTLLFSVSMLMLFSRMEIRRGKALLSALSASSFGVYLIHDHPQVRQYTIARYAYLLAGLDKVQMIAGIVLAAAGVYLVCTAIDLLRQKLFDLLRLRQRMQALETRLLGGLWDD